MFAPALMVESKCQLGEYHDYGLIPPQIRREQLTGSSHELVAP